MIQNFNDDMKCKNKTITLPEFRASIHNRFDIEVIDSITGEIKQKAVGHNVICDQLWTNLFNTSSNTFNYFNYIFYGGGSGTPSNTDTQLFSHIGGASGGSLVRSIDNVNGVYSCRKSIQLTAGTAVGKTITEVGIGASSSSTSLCTHAMLKDLDGNLTSITKTDTDVVNIYATVFVHYNPSGYDNKSIFVVYIDESSRVDGKDLLGWLAGTWPAGELLLARAEFSPYGGYGLRGASQSGVNFETYTMKSISKNMNVASKKVTMTLGRLEAADANYGGIRSIGIFGRWNYGDNGEYMNLQLICQPGGDWFPNSIIEDENIGIGDGTTTDFSFDFHFVKNAHIYIDGVETTDFTLDYAPNTTTNWGWWMEGIHKDSTPDNHIRMFYNRGWANYDGWYNKEMYFYNPMHEIGLSSVTISGTGRTLYASNDLQEWITIGSGKTINIGTAYQKYKYWKVTAPTTSNMYITAMTAPSTYTGKALHFNTAPPAGAIITADYECDVIAKDENNVFDMTVEIQLGEYTEET